MHNAKVWPDARNSHVGCVVFATHSIDNLSTTYYISANISWGIDCEIAFSTGFYETYTWRAAVRLDSITQSRMCVIECAFWVPHVVRSRIKIIWYYNDWSGCHLPTCLTHPCNCSLWKESENIFVMSVVSVLWTFKFENDCRGAQLLT